MKPVILGMALLWCLMPWRAALSDPATARTLADALEQRTPGAMLQNLRDQPERFLEDAAGLVLGFGGPDGIDRAGIEAAIAVERARVRAREMRRLLEADLDDDLVVTRQELAVVIASASATMRGRLLMWHRAADTDRDGRATWPELRGYATLRAHNALSDAAAAAMRAIMIFDLDGDGRVRMDEVLEATDLLANPA